jgi:hypothetical protein
MPSLFILIIPYAATVFSRAEPIDDCIENIFIDPFNAVTPLRTNEYTKEAAKTISTVDLLLLLTKLYIIGLRSIHRSI